VDLVIERPGLLISRRSFLYLTTAVSALAVTGCDLPFFTQKKDKNSVPFGIWESMRDGARSSPDHVTAAADRAVASRDPATILAFVRDQIATYPATSSSGDLGTAVRWGVPGTLRGGAGTPREKAELLAALYRRAGLKAEVVTGVLSDNVDLLSLFRPVQRQFDPQVDMSTIEGWRSAIRVHEPIKRVDRLDESGSQTKALAKAISAVLPAGLAASDNATPVLRGIPLVRVHTSGGVKYANPLVQKAELGKSYTTGDPTNASEPDKPLPITVRLFASTTADPIKRIPLVEKTWSADQVVGRRIHLAFRPTPQMETLVHLNIRDIRTFIPALSVSGQGLDANGMAKLSASGPAISVGGDIIAAKPDGSVTINDQTAMRPSTADPHAGDRVASLSVDIASQTFPNMRLRVKALDAAGKPVEGLPASAFRLKEQDTSLSFLMTDNQVPPPRVLLILDLDSNFTTGGDPSAFARTLAQQLLAGHPGVGIQVMSVSGGNSPTPDGYTLRDPDAVAAAVKPLFTYGSDIWTALQYANAARPTVIVLTSDFAPDEKEVGGFRAGVAAGAPVVAIGVGPFNAAVRNDIAQLSGGKAAAATSIDEAVKTAVDFLDRRQSQPYVLAYTAPATGPDRRTVTVSTVKGVSGHTEYALPPPDQRAPALALAGLYVSVQVGYEPEVTRVLAGYRSDTRPPNGLVAQDILDEVRGALYGEALLSVEGAAPSLGTWVDDMLTAKLGTRNFWDGAFKNDEHAVVSALKAGAASVPDVLATVHPPLPDDGRWLTYETGLRLVLYKQYPIFGKGRRREVDVLPFTRWATLTKDSTQNFQTTLARSAYLALAEAEALPTSTLSELKDKQLKALAPGSVFDADLEFVPQASRRAWSTLLNNWSAYHRVVPADGAPFAFWAVDPRTGSMLGVLGDGSGGSSYEENECIINNTQSMMSLLAFFLGELGGLGGIGVWAIFAKIEAAQMLRASYIFEHMEDEGIEKLVEDAQKKFFSEAKDAACDLVKHGLLNNKWVEHKIGKEVQEALSNADGFADVLHRSMPCPPFTHLSKEKNC
jgi:hypothetical protein